MKRRARLGSWFWWFLGLGEATHCSAWWSRFLEDWTVLVALPLHITPPPHGTSLESKHLPHEPWRDTWDSNHSKDHAMNIEVSGKPSNVNWTWQSFLATGGNHCGLFLFQGNVHLLHMFVSSRVYSFKELQVDFFLPESARPEITHCILWNLSDFQVTVLCACVHLMFKSQVVYPSELQPSNIASQNKIILS